MRTAIAVLTKTKHVFIPKSYDFSSIIPGIHVSHECSHSPSIKCKSFMLLQEPSRVRSLDETKCLHALSFTIDSNEVNLLFLHNNIISNYSAFGAIQAARKVFDRMPRKNIISFNAMISAYSRDGDAAEAWKLFAEIKARSLEPTQFTFVGLLSCDSLLLVQGLQLQPLTVKSGLFVADAFTGTALMGMFGRFGCLDDAIEVFEEMPKKNLVTWNSMISLLVQFDYIEESTLTFRELIRTGIQLSEYTFVAILSGLMEESDLEVGHQIHGTGIKIGLTNVVLVANSLINMYAKCSGLYLAEKMFHAAFVKDVVSWNTIIGTMSKSNEPLKALETFLEMSSNGVLPNSTTLVYVLNSCTTLEIPSYGESVHGKAIKKKFESNVYVGSALVDFYAKFDRLESCHHCFEELQEKSLASWNSLIHGHSHRSSSTSLLLLQEMLCLGLRPNEFSFSSISKSLLQLELQQIHSLVMKMGYHMNPYVLSYLLTSYARNGLISDALKFTDASDSPLAVVPLNVIAGIHNRSSRYGKTQDLYSVLEDPDIISWNILITACSKNGDYDEVFELFAHMRAHVLPDKYTYVSVFNACTKLCNLPLGSTIHGLILKTNFKQIDVFVNNTMIDMYAKCGSLESSMKIFHETPDKNLISYTVLVSALGLHGHAHEAIEKFKEMEAQGFIPDKIAFIAFLSACRHAGLVKEGMELFHKMKEKYGFEPEVDHYVLAVDLLTRYGHIREAENLITGMPFPANALIWRTFLEGCKRKNLNRSTSCYC